MKLELFGSDENGWSAHGQSDASDRLLPCPFCGSPEVEVSNTHTPCYWGQCSNCLAEGPTSPSPDRRATSKRGVKRQHEVAFAKGVLNWNTRAQP